MSYQLGHAPSGSDHEGALACSSILRQLDASYQGWELPDNVDRILLKPRVAAKQNGTLNDGLSNQQTIKWILVMEGQIRQFQNVLQNNG